jgi:hypothetical protein
MFYLHQASITVEPPDDYPTRPYQAASETFESIAAGAEKHNGTVWAVPYGRLNDEELDAVFRTVLMLAQTVSLPVDFGVLDSPLAVEFRRNDNNLWIKAAPALAAYAGQWLRGQLSARGGTVSFSVTLEPLAGGQPGWRAPRFESDEVARSVWPPNEFGAQHRLVVEQHGVGTASAEVAEHAEPA